MRHGGCGGAAILVKNTELGKNVDKAVTVDDMVKIRQKNRSIKSTALLTEEVEFHLLMALAFHDLQRKKLGHPLNPLLEYIYSKIYSKMV